MTQAHETEIDHDMLTQCGANDPTGLLSILLMCIVCGGLWMASIYG